MPEPGPAALPGSPWRVRWAIFGLSAVVSSVFLINLCDLIYNCGCESLWAGQADHCNIHNSGGRHCPWCSIGNPGYFGIILGIVGTQAVVSLGPKAWGWRSRLAAGLIAFPVAGGLIGVGLGWWMSYWK
jgi:hypothetical protein